MSGTNHSTKDAVVQAESSNSNSEPWPDDRDTLNAASLAPEQGSDEFLLDISGFEGPLDLLLDLARHHKIDLTQISILQLVDQYLAYIDRARTLRLDVAADYLVMAAWLAYLKSRTIIPAPPNADDKQPENMAARLAFRLQRLQAMRESAAKILDLPQLGHSVFSRGAPEPLVIETQRIYGDTLIDLLKAYSDRRQRKLVKQTYTVKRQPTFSIKEAREALEKLVGVMSDWGTLDAWLVKYMSSPETKRSVRASSFTASLELAREGVLELRQDSAFEPIYLRRRPAAA
jgi:segregation and condensation protein A